MGIIRRGEIYHVKKSICGQNFRFSLKTSDKRLAKELYDLWIKDTLAAMVIQKSRLIENPRQPLPSLQDITRPTLSNAFNEFIKSLNTKNISQAHKAHRTKIQSILKQQNLEWENINPQEIDKLQAKIQSDYAPHTAFKLIGGLISFLRFAVKRGYYTQNDYAMLDFMRTPKTKKRSVIFSDADIENIIFYCTQRGDLDFLYYILTLYFTASRPSEITNLTYKDIDFQNERVTIWMNKVEKHKTVPLPKFFLDELMNLVKFNERTDGYLFIGQGKQKEFYSKKFKAMREALELNPTYSLYLFRHTAGTKALASSQNIHLVKELLGHDNIKTTSQYYMLDNPEHTRPAVNMLIKGIYGNNVGA